jgi:hypothetical protein
MLVVPRAPKVPGLAKKVSMSHKDYNFDPRAIPADRLAASGEVAVASAHTESVVAVAIRGCAGADVATAKAATAARSMRRLEEVLRSLDLRLFGGENRERLGELLNQIGEGFERGATYIHNSVCLDSETGEYLIAKRSMCGALSGELVPVTVAEVREEAKVIYQAGIALLAFLMQKKLLPSLGRNVRPSAHRSQPLKRRRASAAVGK